MSKRKFSKKIIAIIILGVFLIGLSSGMIIQKVRQQRRPCVDLESTQLKHLDLSLIDQALELIKKNFAYTNKIDYQELSYGVIKGITDALDDPYTSFFDPEKAQMFQEDLSGSIEGVGMEVALKDNQLTVVTPLQDTPAEKAGLLPQDKIIAVDGQSTTDLTLDEAVNLIRGPKSSAVTLTISRSDSFEKKDFTITRDVIKIPVVEWEKRQDNVAYIRIFQFTHNLPSRFEQVATEILNKPQIDKIILDLRSNPGGYLTVAQDITGWFLEKDKIVTQEKGVTNKIFRAKGNEKFASYPTVVLINQGTASAAEILAAALEENRGVKLIGETSFGKGTVQELHSLYDNSLLKITTTEWLTPNGNSINETGLKPNIKVEMSLEKFFQDKDDPQLQKAIKVINQL